MLSRSSPREALFFFLYLHISSRCRLSASLAYASLLMMSVVSLFTHNILKRYGCCDIRGGKCTPAYPCSVVGVFARSLLGRGVLLPYSTYSVRRLLLLLVLVVLSHTHTNLYCCLCHEFTFRTICTSRYECLPTTLRRMRRCCRKRSLAYPLCVVDVCT